jgi:hypothetical protein
VLEFSICGLSLDMKYPERVMLSVTNARHIGKLSTNQTSMSTCTRLSGVWPLLLECTVGTVTIQAQEWR